uniref:C2H2-type domain-containing protein n=1 Tax=Strongyloides papillosus TaxID=174720 RepID=A0A0N5BSH3_STREA
MGGPHLLYTCSRTYKSIDNLIKHCKSTHNLPGMGKLHRQVQITELQNVKLMLEESDDEDLMNTDYETDTEVVNFQSLSRMRRNTAPAPVAAPVAAPVPVPVADSTVDQHEPMDVGIHNNPPDVITDTSTVESNANDSLMKANWVETFILKFLYKTPFSDSTMESVIETIRSIISKVCDDIVTICQNNQPANREVLNYISDLCEMSCMTNLVKKINGREEIKEKIVHVDTAARGVDEPPRAYSAFYLSLKDSIERYLNMKHILPYIQFPRPSEQNIIDSCLCGIEYKTLYNQYKKFLVVNVYIDDVSLNSPIGSCSDNNGITNVSYSIPNVVRRRCTLDNIQPFIVTLSEHAKKNSYQEIAKIIKNEFEGLEVRVGEEMIPCKLFMLKGDNLAVNSILKLSASFSPKSATNQCCFCLCTYDQFQEHLSS